MEDVLLIHQLRDRINLLEEQIRQMRRDLLPADTTLSGILSYQQASLAMAIYNKSLATYAYLDHVTAETGRYLRAEGGEYERLRMKVAVFKLRKNLRKHGVEVSTRRGVGYYFDDENRAKLEKLMEKKNG